MRFRAKIRRLEKRNKKLRSENIILKAKIVKLNKYSKFDILDIEEEKEEQLC